MPPSRLKLAAIDLDGTLLSHDLTISPENLQAIRTLHQRGVAIAIASGRHYLSVKQFLQSLSEVQWIVSVQGGEIANRDRTLILARDFMQPAHVELTVDQATRLGLTPIVYGTDGVFTHLPENENLAYYQHLSGLTPVQTSRENLARMPVFKVLWAGQPDQISAVLAAPPLSPDFDRVRTHSRTVEFMPNGITKATGLQTLATHLKISPADAVVFGDADNDIPMFQWAGLSVAMAHGWPTALARAINAILDR